MILCDSNLDRFVRNRDYDYLCTLPPAMRAAEKFRLETEALELEIRPTDEIVGWFTFVREHCPEKPFPDELGKESMRRLQQSVDDSGSSVTVDRGHTLLDYAHILRYGLIDYEKRIEAELQKYPGCCESSFQTCECRARKG